jgi:hypothetical protein
MITNEGEKILRSLRKAGATPMLVVTADDGAHVIVAGREFGDSPDANRAFLDAVGALKAVSFLRQTGEQTFELTSGGARLADALAQEADAEAIIPDTCVLRLGGAEHKVTYIGVHCGSPPQENYSGTSGVSIGTGMYIGHAGFFVVDNSAGQHVFGVLLGPHTFGYLDRQESVPAEDMNRLFKRPGLRSVRDCLLGTQTPDKNGRLIYPEGAPYDTQSIGELVEASDDPLATVLADCERDTLRLLCDVRQQRRPGGATVAEIAAWPGKSRYYCVSSHIRATLDDLEGKGLVRTSDSVHYEVEVRRLADVRRVIAGLLSDQLFDAEPLPQQAAYVPRSTNEFDAFLCHASEDKNGIVAHFAKAMEQAGLKPWWDRGQIKWGDNLVGKVQEGLSRSRYVVLFLSNAFLGKPWPETELNTAMSMEIGTRALVLPILLGLTHNELKARYPMVSAKLYRVVPGYSPGTAVDQALIAGLVHELVSLLRPD